MQGLINQLLVNMTCARRIQFNYRLLGELRFTKYVKYEINFDCIKTIPQYKQAKNDCRASFTVIKY